MTREINPAWRVDVLVERLTDRVLERSVDRHPLVERLKREVGLDFGEIVRSQVTQHLKREKITDIKSLRRALRK